MIENPLPKTLPGAVCAQFRCRNGKVYGPYYFRFWRDRGKLKKQYVPGDQVALIRALCQAHREQCARDLQEVTRARSALRELNDRFKQLGKLRP